ncbi:MAG TPA: YbjN domain-containing protein [Gemmatimonadales bacterium]|nr:YbjN domain-containing protein [Gemmatimonadales bacterium]
MDLAALRIAIPAAIDALGGNSRVSALEGDAWAIFRGSVTGYVAVLNAEAEGDPLVHVSFPIMHIPEREAEPLLRRLLLLNHDLGAIAGFSLDRRGKVWLGASRFAADLDDTELRELIAQLAGLADHYDDELLAEFGRELAIE